MTESLDFKDLERRPLRSWNADGLPELMMGLLWIIWGVAWQLGQALGNTGPGRFYTLFMPAVLVLTSVAALWAIRKLKERITFPRAGYVKLKEPGPRERFAAAAIALVTAALLAALAARGRTLGLQQAGAPGMAVLLSLSFVVLSIRQRAPHLLALAGVALTLGLAFAALEIGWEDAYWILIAVGAATAIAGALRLRWFLELHPLENPK